MKYNASAVQLSVYEGSPTPIKKLIAEQTNCTLDLTTSTIPVTSKQNGGWNEVLGGLQSGTVSVDFFDDTETAPSEVNGNKVFDIWKARTRPKWVIESPLSGTMTVEFYGLITSYKMERNMETGATGSITIEIVQQPTTSVVV